MEYLVILCFAALTAFWRHQDGRDAPIRVDKSSLYGTGIVALAGVYTYLANYLANGYDTYTLGAITLATILVWRMLLQGFKWPKLLKDRTWFKENTGWTSWKFMLITRALPCGVFGVAHMLYTQTATATLLAISGLIISAVYVEGARYEEARKNKIGKPFPVFPSQQWGELSHLFLVAGLVTLAPLS
jgi:hypothetical protein